MRVTRPRQRARGEQLGGPVVVADAVDDREVRPGEDARVGRRRVVAVRVGVGVDDDARDARRASRRADRDAAPEVLGRDHGEPSAGPARRRRSRRSRAARREDEHCTARLRRSPLRRPARLGSLHERAGANAPLLDYSRLNLIMRSESRRLRPVGRRRVTLHARGAVADDRRRSSATSPEPIMARAATRELSGRLAPAADARCARICSRSTASRAWSTSSATSSPGDRLAALDWLSGELDRAFAGTATHPLLRALAPTIAACGLPREPFERLIEANRVDQRVHSYETWEDLLGYCHLSAEPGRRAGARASSAPRRPSGSRSPTPSAPRCS